MLRFPASAAEFERILAGGMGKLVDDTRYRSRSDWCLPRRSQPDMPLRIAWSISTFGMSPNAARPPGLRPWNTAGPCRLSGSAAGGQPDRLTGNAHPAAERSLPSASSPPVNLRASRVIEVVRHVLFARPDQRPACPVSVAITTIWRTKSVAKRQPNPPPSNCAERRISRPAGPTLQR